MILNNCYRLARTFFDNFYKILIWTVTFYDIVMKLQ